MGSVPNCATECATVPFRFWVGRGGLKGDPPDSVAKWHKGVIIGEFGGEKLVVIRTKYFHQQWHCL